MRKNKFLEISQSAYKVVLWGTGMLAKKYVPFLRENGITIYAVCDNDQKNWGNVIFGTRVFAPKELERLCDREDIILVIATIHYREICEQVKNYKFIDILDLNDLEIANCLCRVAKENNYSQKEVFECVDNSLKIQKLMDNRKKRDQLIERYLKEEFQWFKKKYKLSICAIIKNEGEGMLEWIEYHRLVGVEHFYIYDNESTDEMFERLQAYVEEGVITYCMWPGERQQLNVYNHMIEMYKYETEYVAFIDGDEFLVPVINKTIYEIVDDIFSEHSNVGGVGVNWRNYGSSFFKEKPEGLLIENYKYREKDFGPRNAHIKSICNPRRIVVYNHPHYPEYKEGYHCVSENGSYIPGAFFYDGIGMKLRLNHYRKTNKELSERYMAGKACMPKDMVENALTELLAESDTWNEVYDPIMEPYIERLKEKLSEYWKNQRDWSKYGRE